MKSLLRLLSLCAITLATCAAAAAQCTNPLPDPAPFGPPDKRTMRVIDARPDVINAAEGKHEFGRRGTVAVVNMNPFVFKTYRIVVNETPIADTSVIKFAKLLIPFAGDLESNAESAAAFGARFESGPAGRAEVKFDYLKRLVTPTPAYLMARAPAGKNPDGTVMYDFQCHSKACDALRYISEIKDELLNKEAQLRSDFQTLEADAALKTTRAEFTSLGAIIYRRDTDTAKLCDAANSLHTRLAAMGAYPTQDRMNEEQARVQNLADLAAALKDRLDAYEKDESIKEELKSTDPNVNPKLNRTNSVKGFDYFDSMKSLAAEAEGSVVGKYRKKATDAFNEVVKFDNMKAAIEQIKGQENVVLRQVFPVGGKFDFSKVEIKVEPVEWTKEEQREAEAAYRPSVALSNPGRTVTNQPDGGGGTLSSPPSTGGGPSAETASPAGRNFFVRNVSSESAPEADGKDGDKGGKGDKDDDGGAGQQAATGRSDEVSVGSPRFALSVGMAYSPLAKREFQVAAGFARDRQGNLTNGQTLTKVVGLSENSERRLLPLAMLHTRLTDNPRYNLFFSLGVTAKRDDAGTDVEFLIGPSVSLGRNLFVTVGGYAGRQQRIAGDDLFVGSALPEDLEDVAVTKSYRWKPGVAFTYRLPLSGSGGQKAESGGGGGAGRQDAVFTGQPRFSLSVGMAFTSLERREFQKIVGFERDAGGNLVNGETLTSVVGFSEKSHRRISPMALLHTRLLGPHPRHNLYFSLGVTGKKDKAGTDIEYLLGPSVSFWRNQLFFTAGVYAGKQQRLAGDLFTGAKLPEGVTDIGVEKSYHFRPGFAFSYRLPVMGAH